MTTGKLLVNSLKVEGSIKLTWRGDFRSIINTFFHRVKIRTG